MSVITQEQRRALEGILAATEVAIPEFDVGSVDRECLVMVRASLCQVLGKRQLRCVGVA